MVIEYPWHPLHGSTVPLIRRTGRLGSEVAHVEVRRGLCRELPAWMLDASMCAAMSLGAPQVSIEALNELRSVLTGRVAAPSAVGPLNSLEEEGRSDEATHTSIKKTTRAGPGRRGSGRTKAATGTGRTRRGGEGPSLAELLLEALGKPDDKEVGRERRANHES